jgi:hypothetical protein
MQTVLKLLVAHAVGAIPSRGGSRPHWPRQRWICCGWLIASSFAVTLTAQQPPTADSARQSPPAGVHGNASQRYRFRVLGAYDEASGQPIADVEVDDVLSGLHSLTTASGTVSLFFLPDGGSLVRLRKVGYEPQTIPVAISPADTTPITIVLRKVASLPAVKVNAAATQYRSFKLQAASERMASHSGGYFLDEATLRANDNTTLANVIRSHFPGLMSASGPHSETYFLSSRQTCRRSLGCVRPDCYVSVYIDGVQSTLLPDFSRFSPQDYAIVEFYPGPADTPAEFGGTNAPCGTLLLWSRER